MSDRKEKLERPFIILAEADDKRRKCPKWRCVSGGFRDDYDVLKIPRDPTPAGYLSGVASPSGLVIAEKRRRGKTRGLVVGRGLRRDGSVASDIRTLRDIRKLHLLGTRGARARASSLGKSESGEGGRPRRKKERETVPRYRCWKIDRDREPVVRRRNVTSDEEASRTTTRSSMHRSGDTWSEGETAGEREGRRDGQT